MGYAANQGGGAGSANPYATSSTTLAPMPGGNMPTFRPAVPALANPAAPAPGAAATPGATVPPAATGAIPAPAAGANINELAMSGITGGMAGAAAAGNYTPEMISAGTVAGTDLSAYTNPFENQVVNQTMEDMQRALTQQQMLTGAQMGAAGAFGGSRHGIAESESNRSFYDKLGSTVGALRSGGFENAQTMALADIGNTMKADLANQGAGFDAAGLQLAGAKTFADIGNLGFGMGQIINENLMNQGNIQQLMNQQLIDAAKGQFAGYTGAPASTISYVSNALGSSPLPQSQTTTKQPGLFDYLSLGASAAGAMGMSDMRLKTNIERVGELPNGLGLYTWEWTEDAKEKGLSNSMTLGAIAQEVEAFDPSLTVTTPSGYLAVKYNELYQGL